MGTATVYATAYNDSGATIPSLQVIFTLDDPILGYITSTAITDASGVATGQPLHLLLEAMQVLLVLPQQQEVSAIPLQKK